ncbi:MAG: hypothetical protein HWQ36_25920 [Nostoc sp. NMS2]|uniref:DUF6464 family protein n=1 Tax=Nostoc sp. NMS2 TaxID=2815389 RepID=UPI0025E68FEA|nr:DUF6464 family protein [Nostoc sp. NMS2]MBN3993824.1 hypothetical protein [Nostoc sp. NMS2]
MESIRQRRRNRHRVKAVQKRVKRPITLVLNIDVTKINAIFAQTKDVMMRLAGIQEIAAEALQIFALIPPNVIRGMISVQQTRAVVQEIEVDYLGDPSCKFNARSPFMQCAVNPSGNCANCQHFEL